MNLQFQAQAFNVMNVQFLGVPDPRINNVGSFQTTTFNSNGGLTLSTRSPTVLLAAACSLA